jgi:Ni,Fe-hydrogenase I cytochrome b subunit
MEVHGEGGAHREPVRAYGVGLWKNIMRVWGKFSCHTKFKVGDGFKVRLWHDLCSWDVTLKEAFHVYLVLFSQMMLLLWITW